MLGSSRARLLLLSAFGLIFAGASPPEFRGCGSEGPPAGDVPLPIADGGTCVRDTDCPTDACMDVRCLAGACMSVAPLLDRDGDGRAPPPCGDDCDDTDASTFPGASERCDGVDNDCNGVIDDGAPRSDARFSFMAGDTTSIVLGWGSGFLFTERTAGALWGIPVGLDGTIGSAIELMRLTMGSSIARVAGATAADGTVLILSVTDFGASRYTVFDPTGPGDPVRVVPPTSMPLPADVATVETVEVIAFSPGWAIGYDGTTPTGAFRFVTTDPASEPVIRIALGDVSPSSFGLASDGTHVVVTDSVDQVVFFDPDGVEAGRHGVPDLSVGRHLASADGSVIVITPDGFDFTLAHVTLAAGPGASSPAPFGDSDDEVVLCSAADLVLVARSNPRGSTMTVQALLGDLVTYEGSPIIFSEPGPVARFSCTATGAVVAVGGSHSGTMDVGVLRACGG